MFAFCVLKAPTSGPPGAPDGVVWGASAQLLDAVDGGSPVADGGLVASWLAEDSVNDLEQSVNGRRPIADIDGLFPGRSAIIVSADRHLHSPLTDPPGTFLLIVGPQGSVARVLLTRDTTQSTTAPAFSVAVEEYFV